jgi:magnesium chelatase family protein
MIFCDSRGRDARENYSAAVYGVDAYEVEIEVNGAGGDPNIVIVGLPDAAVKESRDRVTTAVANSGYYWPRGRTTINLAPADIKKEGPSFDLPIALGMIAVTEGLDSSPFESFSFVGELALDGSVRAVKGVLPVALEARRRGKRALFVPEAKPSKPQWSIRSISTASRTCDRRLRFCVAKLRFCPRALI